MLNPIRKDVKTFCSIFFTIFFLIVSGMFWTAAIAQVIYNDQDHLRIETLPKSSEHFEKEFIKKSDKSFETIENVESQPKLTKSKPKLTKKQSKSWPKAQPAKSQPKAT